MLSFYYTVSACYYYNSPGRVYSCALQVHQTWIWQRTRCTVSYYGLLQFTTYKQIMEGFVLLFFYLSIRQKSIRVRLVLISKGGIPRCSLNAVTNSHMRLPVTSLTDGLGRSVTAFRPHRGIPPNPSPPLVDDSHFS